MKNSGIEWIGEIPDSWKLERLQWHMFEIKEQNTPVKTMQVLSLTNKLGVVPYEQKGEQGNKSKENYEEYKIAYPQTIVANSMNILIGSVGICNYLGCVSPVYYVFKPLENENIEYLNYVFQLTEFQKELRKYASGILEIRLRLAASDILKQEVAFPSKAEQKKIVEYLHQKLSNVDKLIEVQQAQIDKLKEYKQSVITEAVTKGLDPTVPMKDVSNWMRRIPCNWFEPKIKYFCSIESGGTPERTHPEYWNGDINWFKTGELHNDEIFDSEEKITVKAIEETAAKIFPKNTILVAMYGQGKTRGMTALLKKESATNQACAAIQLKTKTYEVNYLWWVLKGAYNSLRERANGSGQPNLSVSLISEFEISLPLLLEQQKIICYLDDKCAKIDKLIAIKQAKIDKLQEYKKSLIYEYVTGKKEVM